MFFPLTPRAVAGVFLLLLPPLLAARLGLSAPPPVPIPAPPPPAPPAARREFRGVWIATVANIDWPSRPGLPSDQQKAELVALLDRAKALNLNAIVFQVRSACDALYASPLEPWSEYLTGQMGRAPDPPYDPLAFVIDEAHKRGLELHAWFNPFRARHASAKSEPSPDHVSRAHSDWVKTYGKQRWLDPGEPAVQDHDLKVILDVVRRYDVDGIHLDDYFYPYPENDAATGMPLPFPDDASWARYGQTGGKLGRADWRRENVSALVRRLGPAIHAEKPWVKFGISPFGIGRPGSPPQIQGFDPYAQIYADAPRWLREGWVDYLSPQLYWKIETPGQSFPVLLNWWAGQNVQNRHLWPGLFTSRTLGGAAAAWPADEIAYQVRVTRGQAGATGSIHFSAKALMPASNDSGSGDAKGVGSVLASGVYAEPALVPASPWLKSGGGAGAASPPLPKPLVTLAATPPAGEPTGAVTVSWRLPASASGIAAPAPWLWVVQVKGAGVENTAATWTTRIVPGSQGAQPLPATAMPTAVSVFAVDRVGNAGPPTVLAIP